MQNFDFVASINVNTLFLGKIGVEILDDLVAVRHPGFPANHPGPYEQSQKYSKAFVKNGDGKNYFTSTFWLANVKMAEHLIKSLSNAIQIDFDNQIIASWRDESHLNRFLIDNEPTKILNPPFYFPFTWKGLSLAKAKHIVKIMSYKVY